MDFINSLNNKKFIVLCEIDPPKGIDTSGLYEITDLFKGRVDALLVSDMPSAVMTLGSIVTSYILEQRGFNTICNISCRDRNILALQSDILSAAALGLETIYITQGDDITNGDHPRAKPVKEIDAYELLAIVKKMHEGSDSAGNKLSGAPRIKVGTFVNSNLAGDSLDHEISKLENIANDIDFLITPPIFDLQLFEISLDKIKRIIDVPVIADLILLKSVATARFLNSHVNSVNVPDTIIQRLYSAGDKLMESIAIAAELINGLKDNCEGVKITALGWEAKIPAYLDAAKIT